MRSKRLGITKIGTGPYTATINHDAVLGAYRWSVQRPGDEHVFCWGQDASLEDARHNANAALERIMTTPLFPQLSRTLVAA